VPDRDDRVEHRALRAGKLPGIEHRARRDERASAPDELQAIRLVGDLGGIRAVDRHQVEHPRRRLVQRARPARAQDGVALGDDLGLHEEIGEGRVKRVGGRRREDDFGVAGDLERAPRA
jgi:hypothetical protein